MHLYVLKMAYAPSTSQKVPVSIKRDALPLRKPPPALDVFTLVLSVERLLSGTKSPKGAKVFVSLIIIYLWQVC